jgi:hypothetical protein
VAKIDKNNRRAVIEQMRAEQKGAERNRGLAIVGACAAVALAIIGSALWFGSGVPYVSRNWYDEREFQSLALETIGAPASACGKIETKPAVGNQDHVDPGTPITYPDAPPAFGQHYNVWESMDRKLYTEADRPDVGKLVHNLEHGFTILWYDETAAGDKEMMADIEAIALKYKGTDNFRLKFKAAPWLTSDGEAFPEGQHIAMTHWSNGGTGDAATGEQVGVWQYCSAPSGAGLKSFMEKYPYMDSPEPGAI